MRGGRREHTAPGGQLRWYDMSEMGLVRHMPGVAAAWYTFYFLVLAAVLTIAVANRVDGVLRGAVQMTAAVLALAILVTGWRWLRRGSLAWGRLTFVALAVNLVFTLALPWAMGVSATTVGWIVPGTLLSVVGLVGCGLWVRRRARTFGVRAGRFAASDRTPDPPW